MKDERPTHLDLFSGIGGFSIAAEAAGFRTIAFSEVGSYPSEVLRKHWPGICNLGDVTKWEQWPDMGNVSIITGGFPCQPFSCAGKRQGARDDRFLWPSMLGVIRRYKPAWVLGENVPGLIGMELDRCLTDLEGIGFRTFPIVVPACAVDAKHRRDRVWIVAYASSFDDFRQEGEVREGLTRIPESNRGGATWSTEPYLLRVANGVPAWMVQQHKALGNAIVPQVAEVFLRAIYQQLRP